jgi:hypothetical protein
MINIAELMEDPDFAQNYTVYRQTGKFIRGNFVIGHEVNGVWVPGEFPVNFYGPVIPASTKDLEQVPEGDRVTGMMVFYTSAVNPFFISHNKTGDQGSSDQAVWHGERYLILQQLDFSDFGYQKVIGARMAGD